LKSFLALSLLHFSKASATQRFTRILAWLLFERGRGFLGWVSSTVSLDPFWVLPWLQHAVFLCQFLFNLATKGIEMGSGGNDAGQRKILSDPEWKIQRRTFWL
jgi:hypothetical protein